MGNIWAKLFKRQAPIKKNMLQLLPPEMHTLILSNLDCKSLLLLSQTSNHQRSAAKQHKRSRAHALFEACFGEELDLQPDGSRMTVYEFPVKTDGVTRPMLITLSARVLPETFNVSLTETHRFCRLNEHVSLYGKTDVQIWLIPSCGQDGSGFIDGKRLETRALEIAKKRMTRINEMVGLFEGRKVMSE